ncbi:MAG: PD40 domain-containing protein [Elusimicrobia bacterium]|nr:PD40 domain-containing protein [Elusimicrobiota bacterium]
MKVLTGLALALGLCGSLKAATEVHIKVGGQGGADARFALGLPPFIAAAPQKPEDAVTAKQLREIVRADLLFSRYFNLLEQGPHFDGDNRDKIGSDWKNLGSGWLLTAQVSQAGEKLQMIARLDNLNAGEAVFERHYKQDKSYQRSLAHKLSDDVVQAVSGRMGIAQSQIVFANNQSGHKELYLVDYDGENLRQLTRHRSITLLPRFSPDRRYIAYTSYKDGNPDLFLLDLANAGLKVLSNKQGLNIAGGFSADGSQILMTMSRQKSPNLFVKTLSDGQITQLTQHFGADSSPTFSPDASQVAFVSDRSGNPQIYILDMATHRAKRLTNLNWCDSPSWSPTGEWIAFAGRANALDKMDIFLVDVTGNQIRQLTKGEGSNENPSWSPDGRFLAFTSTRNSASGRDKPELYVMDADGSAPHRIVDIPGSSFTPNWSQ